MHGHHDQIFCQPGFVRGRGDGSLFEQLTVVNIHLESSRAVCVRQPPIDSNKIIYYIYCLLHTMSEHSHRPLLMPSTAIRFPRYNPTKTDILGIEVIKIKA